MPPKQNKGEQNDLLSLANLTKHKGNISGYPTIKIIPKQWELLTKLFGRDIQSEYLEHNTNLQKYFRKWEKFFMWVLTPY